jgi:hypothetical protein
MANNHGIITPFSPLTCNPWQRKLIKDNISLEGKKIGAGEQVYAGVEEKRLLL